MFDRLKRSFALVQASAQVLRQDNHLILFPVLSAIACVMVVVAFVLPAFGLASIDSLNGRGPMVYSTAFLFYVVQYFVILYFNTALVGAALIRLDGGSPTLGDGLRVANSRLGAILGFAVISATVGVILRAIQERSGFIGRWVIAFIGAGWAAATYMVIPVIVVQNRGAVGAISDSTALLKRTWGENIAGQAGLGAAFAVLYFLLFGSAFLFFGAFAHALSAAVGLAFVALFVLAYLACAVFHATLSGIYSAALYRYAAHGAGTPGFDNGALENAFQRKD